jgi:hypothetical protein
MKVPRRDGQHRLKTSVPFVLNYVMHVRYINYSCTQIEAKTTNSNDYMGRLSNSNLRNI